MTKRSETTVFVSPNVRNDDAVRYGDWRDTEGPHTWYDGQIDRIPGEGPLSSYVARGVPMTLIDNAIGSNYSGNLVQISNARSLKRDFLWLVEIYGGHGTRGVAYLGKRENQNPRLLEALDFDCLYDEDDHSSLERETADEAWSEPHGGRHDWARALAKHFDEIEEHDLEDERFRGSLDDLWYDCTEHFRGGEA